MDTATFIKEYVHRNISTSQQWEELTIELLTSHIGSP